MGCSRVTTSSPWKTALSVRIREPAMDADAPQENLVWYVLGRLNGTLCRRIAGGSSPIIRIVSAATRFGTASKAVIAQDTGDLAHAAHIAVVHRRGIDVK